MTKETINTTNQFILPASGDAWSEEARRQIVENLQKITPEEVQALGQELAAAKEKQEKEWELLCADDWVTVNYNKSKRIVKWEWKKEGYPDIWDEYDVSTLEWFENAMAVIAIVIKCKYGEAGKEYYWEIFKKIKN